jgi:hypothetical protein
LLAVLAVGKVSVLVVLVAVLVAVGNTSTLRYLWYQVFHTPLQLVQVQHEQLTVIPRQQF